ncbi:MAG: hypothetical protein EOP11_09070 [Proteobacteria bacterium]|nr:MAG: hypothetical protein EOP11_09070 [Pseudomonadota bacterium]
MEHQTGEADYQRVVDSYKVAGFNNVRVEKFIYDMDRAFREAHLVVCRAGASSLAELAAAGKAAVLIPLVSKDRHQEHNAVEIEHVGGALSRLQGSLTGESLAAILKDLYNNPERIQSLAHQMGKLHHPNAAHAIAQSILAKQA